jgi:hypothetical protein
MLQIARVNISTQLRSSRGADKTYVFLRHVAKMSDRFLDIKKNVTTALADISKQEFQKCFQQWQDCCAKCIATQEEYFKGDPSQ